ncbi:nucleoid-associated protein [Aureivirga sp. CE67]|uniref:nucleoid-associated protein n=1 Tax=Aureivirga sp. CE67 TaxID=1788983 RepID=UPI0018CAC1E7|nr:nucleoid-associated protein [Aureivirga sp. CE67]
MIEFSEVKLESFCVHQVGNKLRDEDLKISKENSSFEDTETESYLLKYFLSPFKDNEIYNFTHSSELEMNEIYTLSKRLFSSPENLYDTSIAVSKRLYEKSVHPKVNEGDFCVCYFKNCLVEGVVCDAIGLFKSEVKDVFLKINSSENQRNVAHERGINIQKLDKGCLIFNLEAENGFKVCIVDTKSRDSQYWKEDFLKIKPASDEYHTTNDFLSITKQFLTKQLPNDFEVSKSEQIDLLNKSVAYFKENEYFDKEEFEETVFEDENVIESFREYDTNYREENELEEIANFEISPSAVKKQSRAFKRVLKLDSNFDIYIKGDKNMIEKGVDDRGRKYYKIYYEEEN